MKELNSIIVTQIKRPETIHSRQGRYFEMKNRPYYGISFCMSGQITYTMDEKEYISDPSHVIFLPKGKNYTLYGDRTGLFPVINFDCENFVCDTVEVLPLQNPKQCITDYERIKSMFLFKENKLKIFSLFYELLNNIFVQQLPQKSVLSPVIRYIENNISDPTITNSAIARQACISEVYLRSLFLKEFNTTPKQYILDIRLQKAKQLLATQSRSITSVSEECGFSSVYHFCRIFKQKIGITPSEYSKQSINTVI